MAPLERKCERPRAADGNGARAQPARWPAVLDTRSRTETARATKINSRKGDRDAQHYAQEFRRGSTMSWSRALSLAVEAGAVGKNVGYEGYRTAGRGSGLFDGAQRSQRRQARDRSFVRRWK